MRMMNSSIAAVTNPKSINIWRARASTVATSVHVCVSRRANDRFVRKYVYYLCKHSGDVRRFSHLVFYWRFQFVLVSFSSSSSSSSFFPCKFHNEKR